jgi:hypothetical protein
MDARTWRQQNDGQNLELTVVRFRSRLEGHPRCSSHAEAPNRSSDWQILDHDLRTAGNKTSLDRFWPSPPNWCGTQFGGAESPSPAKMKLDVSVALKRCLTTWCPDSRATPVPPELGPWWLGSFVPGSTQAGHSGPVSDSSQGLSLVPGQQDLGTTSFGLGISEGDLGAGSVPHA